jgi:hypothetical protein
MAKDEKDPRIEGVFSNIGLGNSTPERIVEIVEQYDKAMATADFARNNTGKKKFKDVLSKAQSSAEEKSAEKK